MTKKAMKMSELSMIALPFRLPLRLFRLEEMDVFIWETRFLGRYRSLVAYW